MVCLTPIFKALQVVHIARFRVINKELYKFTKFYKQEGAVHSKPILLQVSLPIKTNDTTQHKTIAALILAAIVNNCRSKCYFEKAEDLSSSKLFLPLSGNPSFYFFPP